MMGVEFVNRMQHTLTVLERLKLGLGGFTRPEMAVPPVKSTPTRRLATFSHEEAMPDNVTYRGIGLRALFDDMGPLAPLSVVIGACDDGLHFYMDLSDPRPGAVLLAGDPGCGKTRLLGSILAAAMLANPARQVRYALIAENLVEYQALTGYTHCYQALPVGSGETLDLLSELTGLVRRRQEQPAPAPAILLVLDDLASLCASLDGPGLQDLICLLTLGPQARIWPFAALHADDLEYVDEAIIQGFSTRILGRMRPSPAAYYLAGPSQPSSGLLAGEQFCVRFDAQWLNFWVPNPQEVL